jgi:formylglycine-generating enzyme required for sulfatase activity
VPPAHDGATDAAGRRGVGCGKQQWRPCELPTSSIAFKNVAGGDWGSTIWQGDFPTHNTIRDGYAGTAPLHSFPANGYGLHNAAGNVWEWCEDYFSPRYHQLTTSHDPRHDERSSNRSLRGGSFLCYESYCNRYRVAASSSNTPDSSSSNVGFRVVKLESGERK